MLFCWSVYFFSGLQKPTLTVKIHHTQGKDGSHWPPKRALAKANQPLPHYPEGQNNWTRIWVSTNWCKCLFDAVLLKSCLAAIVLSSEET